MAFHFEEKKLTVLQEAVQDFSKNEQDNLSKEERNNIKKMIEHIEKTI